MQNHIFVYGLLKSMYDNEPARFIRENCSLIGEGYFPGKLIDIGTYPGAIYQKDSPTKVHGEVFRIDRNEIELVKYLDQFEGVGAQFEEPNEYVRKLIPIQMEENEIDASCYLYNWPIEGKVIIESGRYENVLGNR